MYACADQTFGLKYMCVIIKEGNMLYVHFLHIQIFLIRDHFVADWLFVYI